MPPLDKSELASIAQRSAVAFATAALEKTLPVASGTADVESVLRSMLDELWAYQSAEPRAHTGTMSEAEARALPSGRFYFTYQARLINLIGDGQPRIRKLHDLLGAAIALISFVVWVMHHEERSVYPKKPLVIGNDIAEVTWETLQIGLATLVGASPDPDNALSWQRAALQKLAADHPASKDPNHFGRRVERAYFFPN
jgi:hypothetical protein